MVRGTEKNSNFVKATEMVLLHGAELYLCPSNFHAPNEDLPRAVAHPLSGLPSRRCAAISLTARSACPHPRGGAGQHAGVFRDGGIAVRAGRSEDYRQCTG